MKKWLFSREISFWILLATAIIGIIGAVCYGISGTDESQMTETFMSPLVLTLIIIASLGCLAAMFVKASLLKTITAVVFFAAIVSWAINQAGFIVNVMMGLDGNSFSPSYIFAVVAMVIGFAVSLVLGIIQIIKEK